MKKLAGSSYLIFALLSIIACSTPGNERELSGVIETKIFETSEFDAVDYGSAFEVQIKMSSTYKVTATGDEVDLEDLEAEVVAGVLEISFSNADLFNQVNRGKVKLLIETPSLMDIDAGGASQTTVDGFDSFETLNIDVSGSSKIELNAAVRNLKIDISGASSAVLKQDIGSLEGDLSGSSSLKADDKSILKATLDLSSASSADVNVEQELNVNVSGASQVKYTGSPKVTEETSGAGRVIKQ